MVGWAGAAHTQRADGELKDMDARVHLDRQVGLQPGHRARQLALPAQQLRSPGSNMTSRFPTCRSTSRPFAQVSNNTSAPPPMAVQCQDV